MLSAAAHVVTVAALLGLVDGLLPCTAASLFYGLAGVALTAALLAYEHALVGQGGPGEDRDKAFFDVNAWLSVGFFVLVLVDEWMRPLATKYTVICG